MEKKRKENIFENCTCQQVNKNKDTQQSPADTQQSPRSIVAAVDSICKKRQRSELTETILKLYISSQKEQ